MRCAHSQASALVLGRCGNECGVELVQDVGGDCFEESEPVASVCVVDGGDVAVGESVDVVLGEAGNYVCPGVAGEALDDGHAGEHADGVFSCAGQGGKEGFGFGFP